MTVRQKSVLCPAHRVTCRLMGWAGAGAGQAAAGAGGAGHAGAGRLPAPGALALGAGAPPACHGRRPQQVRPQHATLQGTCCAAALQPRAASMERPWPVLLEVLALLMSPAPSQAGHAELEPAQACSVRQPCRLLKRARWYSGSRRSSTGPALIALARADFVRRRCHVRQRALPAGGASPGKQSRARSPTNESTQSRRPPRLQPCLGRCACSPHCGWGL